MIDKRVTFKWNTDHKGNPIEWVVKRNIRGALVFRDYAHLGGPWSNVSMMLANDSIHAGFKRKLRAAVDKLSAL